MTETWRVYPVIMSYVPANQPTPYLVEIPAFQGETQGRSVADGMRQARTYMGLAASELIVRGKEVPASETHLPVVSAPTIVTLVEVEIGQA